MIDQSWYEKPEGVPARSAAGGVVVRHDGRRAFVAFAREKEFSDYVLPKGHVDPGESTEQAARREIEEEVGIADLCLVGLLDINKRLSFDRSEWKTTHYYLFTTSQVEGQPTDTNQHDQMYWFPFDELPAIFWPEQRALLEVNRDRILFAAGAVGRDTAVMSEAAPPSPSDGGQASS